MKKIALLVGLGVFPLLVYPCFLVISVLPDIVVGDKSMVFMLTYNSLSAFLRRVLADWWSSLPFAYSVFFLAMLPMHLLLDRFGLTGFVARLLSMLLVSGVASVFLLRLDAWGTGVVMVCGVILALLFHLSVVTWRNLQTGVKQ